MKRYFLLALLSAAFLIVACSKDEPAASSSEPPVDPPVSGSTFGRALRSLDIVARVDTIIPVQNPAGYNELYRVSFTQPVDHNNPSAGTFRQKAFLFYVGPDRPTVLYTCGYILYDAYSQRPFIDLAYNMNANLLMVEHRYFGDSKPANDSRWDYLTLGQAAADHHAIIQALKPLLPKEWVSTGTSKDGMTSLFLRYFYPDDIDVTTAFCAPFINSLSYLPIGRYLLEQSGTEEERSQVATLLERLFEDGENGIYTRCLQKLEERHITGDFTYNWYVHECLAYFFSFFSYQTPATRELPSLYSTDNQLINLIFASTLQQEDYSFIYPYCIQCAKELGQFIYDYDHYAYLLDSTAFDLAAVRQNPSDLHPEDVWLYSTYDSAILSDIRANFIPNTSSPILFVYAKDDPWTGARPDRINELSSKLIINPIGVHNHDINNPEHFSLETRNEIMDFIAQYVAYRTDPVVAKRPPISIFHEMKDQFMIHYALRVNG